MSGNIHCHPCIITKPAHKELQKKLNSLREEKDGLESKLARDSCEVDPVEEQLEQQKARLREVKCKIAELNHVKLQLQAEIDRLTAKSAERNEAIQALSKKAETEKTLLMDVLSEATTELQNETQGRIAVQEQVIAAQTPPSPPPPCPRDVSPSTAPSASMLADIELMSSPYAYPLDSTVQRPARYGAQYRRENPIRPIPFPNDLMDEAQCRRN